VIEVDGRYLLVKRNNAPKKGRWWVPGGRIHKGESAVSAVKRKAMEETGLDIHDIEPLGYYECVFKRSSFGRMPGGYHAISIVFVCKASLKEISLDDQSSGWKLGNLPKDFKIRYFNEGKQICQISKER
jgi:colanic acid biosynthesis protein WcaH